MRERYLQRQYHRGRCFVTAALLLVGLLLALTGCTPENKGVPDSGDILTQKTTAEEKQIITVLVKYAFTINGFEQAVEEKFPDVDIVQVGNYTGDMGIAEYASRLEHDDLADIVMTWPLDVGEEYWSDRLLDLSGQSFTSNYNLSMLNDISRDGKLYYLPGPAQVRGIVYNKTLFQEKNWEVPKDFDGFMQLCQTIEKSGMRSLQLGLANEEVLDTAFVGYGYADCYSTPQDSAWIKDYESGKGSFGDHFGPALDTFERLIQGGILKPGDLDISYSGREKMLYSRQCAMAEDSVLMARMGYNQTGTTDEFALMPFFNPSAESDWARLYMVCYIGLNKHLAEPKNKEKYDKVLELMNYISTSEGQDALMVDTGAMFSSLTGKAPPDIPEIQELIPALTSGRYAIFPKLQESLREGLAGMVAGTHTKEDVIAMTDAKSAVESIPTAALEYGNAVEDFTLMETGGFIADTLRAESGSDLALFMDNGKDGRYNGKGVSGRIYKGSVTDTDIKRILPDVKQGETMTLCKVEMTGANLLKTLEHAISVDNSSGGWFYYFSGLRMKFAPAAEPGSRIKSIALENGDAIDPEKVYTIALMDHTVPEEYLISNEDTGEKIFDLLAETIQAQKSIAPTKDGRFVVVDP